ncbi:MAG: response regulator [Rubellimicrobium sp.]|nr:response regulator [Rubellimicrobium sp.]
MPANRPPNRRLQTSARIARTAILVFALMAITVVTLFGGQLLRELPVFRSEPRDNLQWNVTQIELDALRFEGEAAMQAVTPDSSLASLRLLYDLFYSRADIAINGGLFSNPAIIDLHDGLSARLQGYLDRTTPVIDGPDDELRSALQHLASEAAALRIDLRRAAGAIIEREAAAADARREQIARLARDAFAASLVVIAALLSLLALIHALNRTAVRRTADTIRAWSRLRATVAASPDAIIVADSDWNIVECSDAARNIFGHDPGTLGGTDLAAIVPDLRNLVEAVGSIPGTGDEPQPVRFETCARRADGGHFPAELSLAGLRTDEGTFFVAFLRDITLRKSAETAIIEARDSALAADQAKTVFLAVVSHEMRTPLNGVLAALEAVEGMGLSAAQGRFVSLAQDSARQLLRHVNDILDLSTIVAGKINLQEEDVDLRRLIRDLVDAQRPAAAAQNTQIRLAAPADPLPDLRTDPHRLGQIVQNLLTNATKATAGGTISVAFDMVSRSETHATVAISVCDTGIGIAEADQERIFDDFVMVDPSYRRKDGGTGLGLAIARRLSTVLGGGISVDSAPGEGACFRVRLTLPIARATAATAAPSAPPPEETRPDGPLEVLLVEDNQTNRTLIERSLQVLGHNVTVAADGMEGVRIAVARHFDVILMDMSMPRMDGVTATSHIRAGGASAGSRIVALTAHSMPSVIEGFLAAGMDGYIIKPVLRADLALALTGAPPPRSRLAAPLAAAPPPADDLTLPILVPGKWNDLTEALGPDGRDSIVSRYFHEFEGLSAALARACTAADRDGAIRLAHEGAGSAAMMGAARLHRFLATIEDLVRAGRLTEAEHLLGDRLAPLWRETMAEFDRVMAPG